ncbi:NADP(H)-dependent aldo-keto reductase [Ascidiimonas sp. W6]|uniref:NADP(H)-dependent aldo-keto reductase n=1 Tax=Ascidiimonas meishanensis TaxID=3128903 RepID=UPI0030EC5D0A
MRYNKIPHTDIEVSKICLGTMTWGEQNTEAEGHEQMSYALDQGVNFFDTAELYSVPAKPETYGSTETIIGTWFKKTGNRDKVVLASKIAGPGEYTKHIRTGGFKKEELQDAVNKSLERLQTDYIDLYQLHWPERNTNFFGQRGYQHTTDEQWEDNIGEVLRGLEELIKAGKIRQIGLSNEVPWGTMRFLEESKYNNLPRMVSIQNPYSLLNRLFETGTAEIAMREGIGLLPYSPLAFGVLSGKYLGGKKPKKGRVTLYPAFSRYSGANSTRATEKYLEIAQKHGLTLTQLALAFVNDRPFVTSNIIGATTMEQLKENIGSIDIQLSDAILEEINAVHEEIPNPAP